MIRMFLVLSMMSSGIAQAAPAPTAAPTTTPLPAALAPTQPKLNPQDLAAAKAVVDRYATRTDVDFSNPQIEKDFETYLRVHVSYGLSGDTTPFILYWKINFKHIMDVIKSNGGSPNWEVIALSGYLAYMDNKVALDKNPSKFKEWQAKAAGNPNAKTIAPYTYSIVTSFVGFFTGIGVAMGTGLIKDGMLRSFMVLGRDILNYYGVKPIVRTTDKLSSIIFNDKRMARIRSKLDANLADVAEALRPFQRDVRAEMSLDEARVAFTKLTDAMTALSETYGKLPESARKAHDSLVDFVVAHPEQLSHLIGTAVSNAEQQRTAANSTLILLGQRAPTNAANLQDLAEELRELTGRQLAVDPSNLHELGALNSQVQALENRMFALGAPEKSILKLAENYRREYVFTREAGSLLAAEMFNRPLNADLSETVDHSYAKFMEANSSNYFRRSLGDTVEVILNDIRTVLRPPDLPVSADRTLRTLASYDNRAANQTTLGRAQGEAISLEKQKSIKGELFRLFTVAGAAR